MHILISQSFQERSAGASKCPSYCCFSFGALHGGQQQMSDLKPNVRLRAGDCTVKSGMEMNFKLVPRSGDAILGHF